MMEMKKFKRMKRLIKSRLSVFQNPNFLLRRYSRRFQVYCVGTAKSGTSSMSGLFCRRYRAAHEPEADLVLDSILAAVSGSINERELVERIRKRDKRIRLEIDSSSLNYWLLDVLVKEFDNAKFILTIRDCYSWLDSFINHQLTYPVSDNWTRLRELRFRPYKFKHAKEEQIFAKYGLYTIDAYLLYWAKHNGDVLAKTPKDRLLVIRTQDISEGMDRIAEFLDIPAESLDVSKSHSFRAKKKFGLLGRIDRDFLEEKVDMHCRTLMDSYFPEL